MAQSKETRERMDREALEEKRRAAALQTTLKLTDMYVGETARIHEYNVCRVVGGWIYESGSGSITFVPAPENDWVSA